MTLYDYCKEQLENIPNIKDFEFDGKRYRENELDNLKSTFGIFESELYEDEYLDYDGADENGPIYLKFRWLVCKIKRSTMYVRTKDEILKVLDVDFGKETKTKIYHTATKTFTKRLVLKEAKTIEELCDMFFIVDNSGKSKPAIVDLGLDEDDEYEAMDLQPYKDACYIHHNIDLYGAIYTDKGLIYVAKMNNEREFELLCQN